MVAIAEPATSSGIATVAALLPSVGATIAASICGSRNNDSNVGGSVAWLAVPTKASRGDSLDDGDC
jgi:hypothetical protein